MDNLVHILILAIVQGVAEFLPISSSGHVVITAELLSPGKAQSMDVGELNLVLHLGTLLSILVFYYRRILRLLGEDRRMIGLLIVGTIPGAVLGLLIKSYWKDALENPLLAGTLLPVTGLMLLLAARWQTGEHEESELDYRRAVMIGAAQAAAILPGLARSGSTIVAGLG